MPIFDLSADGLVPIMRQAINSGVYEREIEDLLWNNIEEITGDNLFRLARQPYLPGGRAARCTRTRQSRARRCYRS